MNSSRPTLSVVLPNYNHARYLPTALDAIVSQSYQPTEVIIIDDGSTDDSRAVIHDYAAKYPFIRDLPNTRNCGVVATLNRGLELANGEFIYFGAADDAVRPEIFAKSIEMLLRHPEAALCSAIAQYVDLEGAPVRLDPVPGVVSNVPIHFDPASALRRIAQHGSWYTGNTAVWRRNAVLELGRFRPELHSFVDGFLFLAAAAKFGACFLPEILGDFRVLPSAVSSELANNPTLIAKRMQEAERIMRNEFADFIPTDFVEHFALASRVRCATLRSIQLSQAAAKKLQTFAGGSRIVRWGSSLHYRAIQAYAHVRLHRLPWHMAIRALLVRAREFAVRHFKPNRGPTLTFRGKLQAARTLFSEVSENIAELPAPLTVSDALLLRLVKASLTSWIALTFLLITTREILSLPFRAGSFVVRTVLRGIVKARKPNLVETNDVSAAGHLQSSRSEPRSRAA